MSLGSATSMPKELETGFPQGSVLGPFMNPMSTSPLFDITDCHNIPSHMYADDTQLYVSFIPSQSDGAITQMQDCLEEIREWMNSNYLKLNNSKTEYIVIGSHHLTKKLDNVSSIVIGEACVNSVVSARNIGVVIDDQLSMAEHVSSVCRTCYMHLRHISQIRKYLTQNAAASLVNALITSSLDYANSILFGLPDYLIWRLELIQNNAARIVLKKKKCDHITPLLKDLHWLPLTFRIKYKINLLTFKALHGLAPGYISELLTVYTPSRTLRSAHKHYLVEKRSHMKKACDRAFSVVAPRLWNKLPNDLI